MMRTGFRQLTQGLLSETFLEAHRVVRVKKTDEGEEEGGELTTDDITALRQGMRHAIDTTLNNASPLQILSFPALSLTLFLSPNSSPPFPLSFPPLLLPSLSPSHSRLPLSSPLPSHQRKISTKNSQHPWLQRSMATRTSRRHCSFSWWVGSTAPLKG